MNNHYSIGQAGVAWGEDERARWFASQQCKRSYQQEVLAKLYRLGHHLNLHYYGALSYQAPYNENRYPLFALKSANWRAAKPTILITGGVHGYETSGVQGCILFLQDEIKQYQERFNFIIVPCVSPWGYETINRWNPLAIDPNRSFRLNGPSPEANAVMRFVSPYQSQLLAHFDLHETTDTDNTEFRPALAARDGVTHDNWDIPDGFYTVGDTSRSNIDFQRAIIDKVRSVTHIAPSDENGQLIGSEVVSDGVILYDKRALFLCGGFTNAKFVTTTEVYPDSSRATPEQCNEAQVAALCGGLDFLS
ncbi:M14 family metallocarboxypeptidase [Ningiella sp. W23]|uniref:M14 family metallopeptidase n=1 Tax=Ningiella sp. W23 TaxID=3023715 RepID=UPI0037579C8C